MALILFENDVDFTASLEKLEGLFAEREEGGKREGEGGRGVGGGMVFMPLDLGTRSSGYGKWGKRAMKITRDVSMIFLA